MVLRAAAPAPALQPPTGAILAAPASAPEVRPAEARAAAARAGRPIPEQLIDSLRDLEAWAKANDRDAKIQLVLFWSMKIPAIAGAAGAGLFNLADQKWLSVAAAAIGTLCVLIDGVAKLGQRYSLYRGAVYEIRALSSGAVDVWRIGPKGRERPERLEQRILQKIADDKQTISRALEKGLEGLDRNADAPVHGASAHHHAA